MKNKSFEKMTAAEKRVAIARDAVKQLDAGKYKSGFSYVTIPDFGEINQRSVGVAKECYVCAIGAALVSGIRLGNRFEFSGGCVSGKETHDSLSRWFSASQINNMEASYEGFNHLGSKKAIAFGKKHEYGSPRMTAIFRNIIANKGTFKP